MAPMTDLSPSPSPTPRGAIVTGGARGLGPATAQRLPAAGPPAVVVYAGRRADADEAVGAIAAAGGTAIAAQADVADEHAVAGVFDLAERTYGGIDVVV